MTKQIAPAQDILEYELKVLCSRADYIGPYDGPPLIAVDQAWEDFYSCKSSVTIVIIETHG